MRAWLVGVVVAVACKKIDEKPSVTPTPTGSAAVAAPAPADASMGAPDADTAPAPAPVDAETLLTTETIGPLKIGMTEAAVAKLLGPPDETPPSQEEGATGDFVTDWSWKAKGVALGMASGRRTGPFSVRSISVGAPAPYATSRGIRIGSTRADLVRTYPRSDEGSDDPTLYLVGSVYGGLLFKLDNDSVVEMFLGAMAF